MRRALIVGFLFVLHAFGHEAERTTENENPLGVVLADRQLGATADVKLNACIVQAIKLSKAAGTSAGAVCDARGLGGAQTIAAQVNVGNASQDPVILVLPEAGKWVITMDDGISCGLKQYGMSSIVGSISGGTGGMEVLAGAEKHMGAMYCTDDAPLGGGSYVRAEGIVFYNPNRAIFSKGGAVLVQKTYDNSTFRNLTVASYNGVGLLVKQACCGTSFWNLTSNGNSGKGAIPVEIASETGTSSNVGIHFFSLSADHPGRGRSNMVITNGGNAENQLTAQAVEFYGVYLEGTDAADTSTPLISIVNAGRVTFSGVTVQRRALGSTAYVFDITNNSAFKTAFQLTGGSFYNDNGAYIKGNVINNHQTGQIVHADEAGMFPNYDGHYRLFGTGPVIFTSIPPHRCQDQNLVVPGVVSKGSSVKVSPNGDIGANLGLGLAYVSESDTVTLRLCNPSTISVTPRVVSWTAEITQ